MKASQRTAPLTILLVLAVAVVGIALAETSGLLHKDLLPGALNMLAAIYLLFVVVEWLPRRRLADTKAFRVKHRCAVIVLGLLACALIGLSILQLLDVTVQTDISAWLYPLFPCCWAASIQCGWVPLRK